jgi:2,4-diaminopentanoate dehydrogenase
MNQRKFAGQPDLNKKYRVVQWAAGRMGKKSIRGIISHPGLELVGLYVYSESKEGQDAGTLSGLPPLGIKATRSIDDVIKLKPDCVLYMQEGFNLDDLCRLLKSGINIITTRSEFFYAEKMDPTIRQRIEEACKQGNSSIHAAGSSPGFSTQVMPLALTYLTRKLDCLTIDEFADIPRSTTPDMITKVMGFGTKSANARIDQAILDNIREGFAQSLSALGDALSIPLDGFETLGECAAANHPITLNDGFVIEKGTMAAQRITVSGMRNGRPVLRFRANWFCSKDLDPKWDVGGEGWRFVVEGDAPLDVRVTYPRTDEGYSEQLAGYTVHPAINAIPYVCAAAPGVQTIFDLPPIISRLG